MRPSGCLAARWRRSVHSRPTSRLGRGANRNGSYGLDSSQPKTGLGGYHRAVHRPAVVLVMAIASLLTLAVVASASVIWRQPGTVTIASGKWGPTPWALGASEPPGSICTALAISGSQRSGGCNSSNSVQNKGMTVQVLMGGTSAVVFGAVVPSARTIVVRSSAGSFKAATLAPRGGISSSIRFYAVQVRCGSGSVFILAQGRSGQVATQWPFAVPC